MSEMVERVAEAIMRALEAEKIFEPGWDGSLSTVGAARAAIAAMREPTEAMKRAALEADALWDADRENDPGIVWREMIDAALEPAGAEAPAE